MRISSGFVFLTPVVFLLCGLLPADGATLYGSFTPLAQGAQVDLTTDGPLDWVHWGLYTETSVNRKATVTPQISNYTLLAPTNSWTLVYQYGDNVIGYSWSDGSPTRTVTDTTTGVYVIGINHGFEIKAPADTTMKTLKVYVGTYGAKGKFQASLSDLSAPAYVDSSLDNAANGPGGVYTINYAARSAGQTLTIKWTVAFMNDPTVGNVTLQAAALTVTGANNPPFVSITSPSQNTTFSAPSSVTVEAAAFDPDGTISKVEFFQGTNKLGEATGSPYSFTWNNASAGYYILTAKATDDGGASFRSSPVEIFVNGAGGALSGSVTFPARTVDLTAEGAADWTHWGLVSSNSFDHKAGVVQQISNFIPIGSNAVQRYADNFTDYTWSDGTPTLSTNNSTTGIFIAGITNGFELSIPADTNSRACNVYVGLYGAAGNFQAYLSDFSAPAYTDMSLSNFYGNAYGVYALNYTAASAGQTLHIKYTSNVLFDQDFGNVTLQSASLVVPAVVDVRIINPAWNESGFSFSFTAASGSSYTVQYTDSLSPMSWQSLTNFSGNGTSVTVTNASTAAQRFYRVSAQ